MIARSFAVALLGVSGAVCGQTFHGTVNVNSEPVAGASVVATNTDAQIKQDYTRTTDSKGEFTIADPRPGSYKFVVTINGEPMPPVGLTLGEGAGYGDLCFPPDTAPCVKSPVPAPTTAGPRAAISAPVTVGPVKPKPLPSLPPPPPPPPPPPSLPDKSIPSANGGSSGIASTLFGLLVASLGENSIERGHSTTLNLDFVPFIYKDRAWRPDDYTFELHLAGVDRLKLDPSDPPAGTRSSGHGPWTWKLKALDDFEGSEITIHCTIYHKLANGEEMAVGTTPRLHLGKKDTPGFYEVYKGIIDAVIGAVAAGLIGFIAGFFQDKFKKKPRRRPKRSAPQTPPPSRA